MCYNVGMKKEKKKYYTYKLNMTVLNILAMILFVVVSGLVWLIEYKDNYKLDVSIGIMFILMFLWLIIHEALHGIGFGIFKDVDRKNIVYGMFLERGVFYCMCKQNIGKRVILTSLLFPITIIGIVTLVIGMMINSFMLVYLSILNIVSSIGDIVMIVYFLKAPRDIIYLDLDDCTSFTVISSSDLGGVKVLGIELVSYGEYDDKKMVAHNYKKITITKFSCIVLIIMLLLGIIVCIM